MGAFSYGFFLPIRRDDHGTGRDKGVIAIDCFRMEEVRFFGVRKKELLGKLNKKED